MSISLRCDRDHWGNRSIFLLLFDEFHHLVENALPLAVILEIVLNSMFVCVVHVFYVNLRYFRFAHSFRHFQKVSYSVLVFPQFLNYLTIISSLRGKLIFFRAKAKPGGTIR